MSRCLKAIGAVLDRVTLQQLLVFLAFVRTAHYWTKLHCELGFEDDIKRLLAIHQELADCVLNDPESASSETAQISARRVVRVAARFFRSVARQ